MNNIAIIPPIDLNLFDYQGSKIITPQDNKYQVWAKQAIIDLDIDQPAPQACITVIQTEIDSTLCTLGNFSLVLGKAKSRKTFFTSLLQAAALKNDTLNVLKGSLPAGKNVVLSFDTEQGNYHVQKAARRVLRLAEAQNRSNFKAYSLRKYAPKDRLKIIEHELYNTSGLGLVVIDGIRDLISSINDEEQATMLVSKLLKWTEELNIHIVGVLHQNKGDNNARGHLGTEAQNKAEIVISITKDTQNPNISVAKAEYCREREFAPFAFEIDQCGLPTVVDHWNPKAMTGRPKKLTPEGISTGMHINILKATFAKSPKPKYNDLRIQIKLAAKDLGLSLSDGSVREFIQYYMGEGTLSQEGKEGTRYSYYVLNLPC